MVYVRINERKETQLIHEKMILSEAKAAVFLGQLQQFKEQLEEKKLIEDGIARGLTEDEILEEHKKCYWTAERAKAQPYEAYKLNTEIVIRQLMNR